VTNIAEQTADNILVIPQGLRGLSDIRVLLETADASIFYKHLEHDLRDIAFYTNAPCFIYITQGIEELTSHTDHLVQIRQNQGVFLPQGLKLHSDYVHKTENLSAYLVFFDQQTITEFLSATKNDTQQAQGPTASPNMPFCVIDDNHLHIHRFFENLVCGIDNPAYLAAKLQELMHLLLQADTEQTLYSLLRHMYHESPSRNITRLLAKSNLLTLSVHELAKLSGRSLSSFNRDFKAIYNTSPKQWLQDKRLEHAKIKLEEGRHSVTHIALEVGYKNVSSFIKAFKKHYGQTPNQLKNGS